MDSHLRFNLARSLVAALSLFLVSGVADAGPKAYVGNFKDNTVSVIDTSAGAVVATIPIAAGPHGMAIAPDGRSAFVEKCRHHLGGFLVRNILPHQELGYVFGSVAPEDFGSGFQFGLRTVELFVRPRPFSPWQPIASGVSPRCPMWSSKALASTRNGRSNCQ